MNRYEEAFLRIWDTFRSSIDCQNHHKNCNGHLIADDLDIIQEVIQKATPKKAILVHNYDGYVYECPNCHNDFRPNYFVNDITWKGCPYCLQALDWTEDTKIL